MSEIKGLILSGGSGTRLRPITHTQAKQLIPVANRPVLFYGIQALVDAGVTEIGIVVSPQTGGEIRTAVGDGAAFSATVTYIEQDEPAGLAHAMLTAEDYLDGSPFVMYLGDNLLNSGIQGLAARFHEESPDALILLTEVDDPESYGVAELEDGRVRRLVEKPREPKSNMALVGVYLFSSRIMDEARKLKPSARGELEITEAIQGLIDSGAEVRSELVSGWWKDTGRRDDMLEANRLVLEQIQGDIEGEVEDSELNGTVVIEAGARVKGSTIDGPVVIARGAVVEDSRIGPYTSIGEDVTITRAEIENSILLSGVSVSDLEVRLDRSLLGRDVVVRGRSEAPTSMQLLIGDRSEIVI